METTVQTQTKTESEIRAEIKDELLEEQSELTNWEGVLSFFIPLIGLILYLSYIHKERYYNLAKKAGNISLLGVLSYILFAIISHDLNKWLYNLIN